MFANQKLLADEDLKRYAEEVGLDVDDFNGCLEVGRFRNDIAEDLQEGQRFGVRGTPAFFVNGRFLSGNQPYEAFAAIIDEELGGTATR